MEVPTAVGPRDFQKSSGDFRGHLIMSCMVLVCNTMIDEVI